jgi:MFS family permease
VVNRLGDFVGLVALSVLVYDRTGDPLATSGLFIAAEFAPALFAPILTARIDRYRPLRVLAALYAAEGILFAGLAGLADVFSLPAVYALVFLDGVLMLSARGISRSAVNRVLAPRALLREGNGLLNVGFALAGVAGAAVGGVLVGSLGASAALAIDALTFVLVALMLATGARVGAVERPAEEKTLDRLRLGLRYARRNRVVRLLVTGESAAIFFFTLILPIEVIYAKETLGTTDAGYGILLAAWSVGTVLGSLAFIAERRRPALTMIGASTACIGVAYLGMGAMTALGPACAFALVGGFGNGIQWVSVMTVLQQSTPQDLQARITGLLESGASAATGVGFLAGGVATALLSPPAAFFIAGGGVFAALVLALPFADGLRRSADAQAASKPTV